MGAAIALAFALAMDATAVSAARGVAPGIRIDGLLLPLLFGAFQGGMAWLGWVTADWGGDWFAAWDHWVAAALLIVIGVKMIREALRDHPQARAARSGVMLYLALALATSLDAGAAGVALPSLAVTPLVAIGWIAAITAVCAALGFWIGRAVGDRFGRHLEWIGGGVLIAIAGKLLVEHLV